MKYISTFFSRVPGTMSGRSSDASVMRAGAPAELDAAAHTRRRLLRGAGGLALSPLVLALAGCGSGDGGGGIPAVPDGGDGGLGAPPPGEGCSQSWNAAAKTLVVSGITDALNAIVPSAGTFAGDMMNIFWPNCGTSAQDDVLSRAQVVDIVNQTNATQQLQAVQGAITTYQTALTYATTETQRQQAFEACMISIGSKDSYFQGDGDEAALLPMFVLYGNLYLAVALDAHVNQAKWGYSAGSPYLDGMQLFLNRAIPYVNQIVEWAYLGGIVDTAVSYHDCEPFRSANSQRTRLNVDALDLAVQWQYYVTIAQGGTSTGKLIAQREVFYGPYGTGDNSGLITLPMAGATGSPLTLTVSSGARLDSVQATYEPGAGPDGVTTTPRGGDNGGSPTVVGEANTVVSGTVWSGDIVNAIQFNYQGGNTTARLGQVGGTEQTFTPDTSLLSSVYVNGVSASYGSADTFVVGFRLDPSKLSPS